MNSLRILALLLGLSLATPRTLLAQQTSPSSPADRHGKRAGLPDFVGLHALDGVAWEPPSSQFARGTLLLAYAQKKGAVLVEWDVEKSSVVRRVSLGATGPADVRLARRGSGVVAVIHQEKQPVRWVLLSPDLKIERQGKMGPGTGAVVVSTEVETFLAWLLPDEKNLALVRLDAKNGKVLARREIPLGEKATRGPGEPSCGLLLSGDRLFLTLETPSHSRLMSLALDLQDAVQTDSPGPRGVLFQEQGPMLAIPRPSQVDLFPLNARLALPRDARQLKRPAPSVLLEVAFDSSRGLALSDGRVFPPGGQERRALVPPFADIHRIFWGHERLFLMATDDKADGGYLLWAE